MTLKPGSRLGAYDITAQIGEGGMGQVFRATDTKLKRQVAIKTLPPSLASDHDRLARFQREAEVLASLNHPHIAGIYGLEESEGVSALVMELVDGEDLSQRIARGAVPMDEALPIAKQIAEALEAAHEQGIIHRDLKPANIKVRPDGTVKVLDFGLAKALDTAASRQQTADGSPHSPTITSPAMTQAGTILGTAAYMSPEQARGRRVDKRADIWAFGCVLYEMLTGRRAFESEDVPLTLANVLQREPDWHALPSNVHPLLATFLRGCLAKDPRERLRDIGDIRLVLDGMSELAGTRGQRSDSAPWQRPASVAAMVFGAAAVIALTIWAFTRRAPAPPPLVSRTLVVLPSTQALEPIGRRVIAISPSGTHVVYVANRQLYVRAIDELEARSLAATEETRPSDPFFSPDGQWIGFYSNRDGALQKVALRGGAAVHLAAAPTIHGASWGEDDTIVYGQEGQGVLRVSAHGGKPDVLVAVGIPERVQQPQLLPGGQFILYTRCVSGGCSTPATWDAAQVVIEELATGRRTVAVQGGADARYLVSGHLIYAVGNTLRAIRFDLQRRAVIGGAVPLVEGVSRAGISGAANAAVSRTGTLVYWEGENEFPRSLVWVDRAGHEEIIPASPRPYYTPRLSPDETRLIVYANDADRDLWVWNFARANFARLTSTPSTELSGTWLPPNGTRVVFNSDIEGTRALYWRKADGIEAVEPLLKNPRPLWPMSITPDGTQLIYAQGEYQNPDLHILTLDSERRTAPLQVTATDAEISPDGRWLAYTSRVSGRAEVYVGPFPSVHLERWPISTAGGTEPLWSRDGRELFYRVQSGAVMRVQVETTSSFAASMPTVVVGARYEQGRRSYDISRDGKRFLMLKTAAGSDPNSGPAGLRQIVVVQNWFEDLKARVPSK